MNKKMKIVFKTKEVTIEGELNDSPTADKIFEKLPLDAKVSTWGEEIYFRIPVSCKADKPTTDVEVGDIAYWMQGYCLCIFFGRTPASIDDKPKPASGVNIIGRVTSGLSLLKHIKDGEKITVIRSG